MYLWQCDQMATLFRQYYAFHNNEKLPISKNYLPKQVSIFTKDHQPFNNGQRFFKSFAKMAQYRQIWLHCFLLYYE